MMGRKPRAVGALNDTGNRWTKTSQIWIPEVENNHRVRVKQLERELNLKEAGATEGRQKLPVTGDRTLNDTQLDVCNRVFSGIVMLNQFLAEQLGQALAAARGRAPEPINANDFRSRITHEVDAVFAESVADLTQLREDELGMQRNMRYFVSKNRLKLAASYRDSLLMVFATVFGMFVVESIANGLLFKDIVTTGLVGGATLAGLISVINIALGIFAGFFGWRYLAHVNWLKKGAGLMVLLLCHGAAVFWNLFVAHFRQVAEAAVRSPTYEFDLALLADQTRGHIHQVGWFGIDSLIALALLGLGVIIHFVASWEGWAELSDHYPGYRHVDLRARTARADYESALVDMRQDARDAANAVVEEAEDAHRTGVQAQRLIADLESLAAQREKEVRDSEDEWVAGGTQLLKMYRDENILVRGDESPPPRYFDIYPAAADYRHRRYDGTGRDDTVDQHAAAAAKAMESLAALRERADATVETNAATLAGLREEVNRILDTLNARVDQARDHANRAASANAPTA